MPDLTSVMLVDSHPLLRLGLAGALKQEPSFFICAEAATANSAMSMVRELHPAVVLLDANLADENALDVAEKMHRTSPNTSVVLLTETGSKNNLLAAFKVGVRGYVVKTATATELLTAVHAVSAGNVYVSPAVAAMLMDALTHGDAPDPLADLSAREREILGFIGNGLTNREIGERVFLSEKTIKHYVTNILQKLKVRSRVEAALFASRHTNAM